MKRLRIQIAVGLIACAGVAGATQPGLDDVAAVAKKHHEAAVGHHTYVLEPSVPRSPIALIRSRFARGRHYYWLYQLAQESGSGDPIALLDAAIMDQQAALDLAQQSCSGEDACSAWESLARDALAMYFRDGLEDLDRAEAQLRALIDRYPSEPRRYYALADLYERFHDAETRPLLQNALELYEIPVQMRPEDPRTYRQVASFLSKYGRFEETIEWLAAARDLTPTDPEGYYVLAIHYWNKVYRDQTLPLVTRQEYIAAGIRQLDEALNLDVDYMEAMIYMSLLLRERAKIDDDPTLIAWANDYRDRGLAVRDRARGKQN